MYTQLVSTNPQTGTQAVNYANITALLLELARTQAQEITALNARITNLEK